MKKATFKEAKQENDIEKGRNKIQYKILTVRQQNNI